MYRSRRIFFLVAVIAIAINLWAEESDVLFTVPAWRNVVEKESAAAAVHAYTSNVVRCEWAGNDIRVMELIPSNMAFQFAVCGDADVTNRIQHILERTVEALEPQTRHFLKETCTLNATLQWMVRTFRPTITNVASYVSHGSHPPVFCESDFNERVLTNIAAKLRPRNIPFPVVLKIEEAEHVMPLGKALAGIDYDDVLPEETYLEPFGCSLIVRAPERMRRIRLSAKVWHVTDRRIEYIWQVSRGGRIYSWSSEKTPSSGYADIIYDVASMGRRLDILVFAKYGDSLISTPSIVSIYNLPNVVRRNENGRLYSITSKKKTKENLYDVSSIWIPHSWTDTFELDSSGKILTYERQLPNQWRTDKFTATGELVCEASSSGYPLTANKVEYYVDNVTKTLGYRIVGNVIKYKLGEAPRRRSGE